MFFGGDEYMWPFTIYLCIYNNIYLRVFHQAKHTHAHTHKHTRQSHKRPTPHTKQLSAYQHVTRIRHNSDVLDSMHDADVASLPTSKSRCVERKRELDRQTNRQRQTGRQTARQTDGQTARERESERERQRQRQRQYRRRKADVEIVIRNHISTQCDFMQCLECRFLQCLERFDLGSRKTIYVISFLETRFTVPYSVSRFPAQEWVYRTPFGWDPLHV